MRSLSVEDYDEIVLWLNDEANKASGDQSIDVDAIVAAQIRKATADDSEEGE